MKHLNKKAAALRRNAGAEVKLARAGYEVERTASQASIADWR